MHGETIKFISHKRKFKLYCKKKWGSIFKKHVAAWTGGITVPSKLLAAARNDPISIIWRVQNYFSLPLPHPVCRPAMQEWTYFPKIQEPPRNSRRQKLCMKEVPYWTLRNFIRHCIKCNRSGLAHACTTGANWVPCRWVSGVQYLEVQFTVYLRLP